MEKYDMVVVLHLPEGEEIAVLRDITKPIEDFVAHMKANCGEMVVTWTAYSKAKKIIGYGTINGGE